ncbi:hypothetical protein GCM10010252_50860 [Streptomyces aureoverticillatus]|nr:hypothetical protein GCM10010252_50860 [Streptomyces aureoverticillatus]
MFRSVSVLGALAVAALTLAPQGAAADAAPVADAAPAAEAPPVIVTQQQALLVLDPNKPVWDFKRDPAAVKWAFDPRTVSGYEDLDPAKNWSKGPNEAKVYQLGGKTYVATVTGKGFAAVVEYPSKKPYWKTSKLITPDDTYAYNPHSIELLPTGEVAVANSGHTATGQARSDRNVCLFPTGNATASSCVKLLHAHGVQWDAGRKRLWALGGDQLKAYSIDRGIPGQPKLKEDTALSTKVPWGAGHDLGLVPGTGRLWVATGTPVFQYDIGAKRWYGDTSRGAQEEYPGWQQVSQRGTKSVTTDPVTGQVITAVAENAEQTTHTARRHFPEARHELFWDGNQSYFYKARWFRPVTIG